MVTSPIESFNNVVSSHADKRIFWGRGWTYRTLVAISILEHNLGPGWMLMAIRELLGHEATKAKCKLWNGLHAGSQDAGISQAAGGLGA